MEGAPQWARDVLFPGILIYEQRSGQVQAQSSWDLPAQLPLEMGDSQTVKLKDLPPKAPSMVSFLLAQSTQ